MAGIAVIAAGDNRQRQFDRSSDTVAARPVGVTVLRADWRYRNPAARGRSADSLFDDRYRLSRDSRLIEDEGSSTADDAAVLSALPLTVARDLDTPRAFERH